MGLLAFIMAYALFAFIFYILQVIAYWKIFTKAGEEGWKSIIPIYNGYVQYRLTWECAVFLGGTGTGGRRRYFEIPSAESWELSVRLRFWEQHS